MPGIIRAVRTISILTALFGVVAIAAPAWVGDFFGLTIEPNNANGYGEIGALYGGVSIAMGVLGLWATLPSRGGGEYLLGAVGTIWACVALSRLVVIVLVEPAAGGLMGWGSFVLEAGLASVFLFLRTTVDPV